MAAGRCHSRRPRLAALLRCLDHPGNRLHDNRQGGPCQSQAVRIRLTASSITADEVATLNRAQPRASGS